MNPEQTAALFLSLVARSGERLANQMVADALKIHDLRQELADARADIQETVVREAEAEAPLLALNKITEYIIERTRVEREALLEPGIWGKTPVGSSVAHTLYADLCHQLDQIRREHGL